MIEQEAIEAHVLAQGTHANHGGVSLYIERLVISGLTLRPGQAVQVQAVIEQELAQLITAGGLNSGIVAAGALPSLSASGIQISANVHAERLGGQIAQALYSGLGETSAVREMK